jgi:hypothetical protein
VIPKPSSFAFDKDHSLVLKVLRALCCAAMHSNLANARAYIYSSRNQSNHYTVKGRHAGTMRLKPELEPRTSVEYDDLPTRDTMPRLTYSPLIYSETSSSLIYGERFRLRPPPYSGYRAEVQGDTFSRALGSAERRVRPTRQIYNLGKGHGIGWLCSMLCQMC